MRPNEDLERRARSRRAPLSPRCCRPGLDPGSCGVDCIPPWRIMAALQDSDAIARYAHARRLISRVVADLLAVTAGYDLTLLVFYPGYVTIDACYVYAD